jgi:hypothetical protein
MNQYATLYLGKDKYYAAYEGYINRVVLFKNIWHTAVQVKTINSKAPFRYNNKVPVIPKPTPKPTPNNKGNYKLVDQTLNLNKNSAIKRIQLIPFLSGVQSYGYALWTFWNHQLATKDGAYK